MIHQRAIQQGMIFIQYAIKQRTIYYNNDTTVMNDNLCFWFAGNFPVAVSKRSETIR